MTYVRKEQLADNITVYQADCRELLPSLGEFDVVATDPPYGMEFRSNHRKVQHAAIANDAEEWPLLLASSIPARHSRYVFCRWDDLPRVNKPRSLVTWVKNNWSMGDLQHEPARQTEVALFYPGEGHYFPSGRPSDVIRVPRTGNENHPTEKPVELMRAVLEWTSGSVIDPFMGSGTTGCAAVQLGRAFVGIELDTNHFETACRRISDELKRPRLPLDEPAPKPVQEVLI